METIIKRGKNADFTIISNGALRNPDLSWKAKGLLSYIMSLPQDWKLNVKDLSNRSSDGRTATASALNELINAGYATREQVKEHGRFVGVVYTVTDCPQKPKSETPQSGFLHTENLKSENLKSENLHTENLQLQINIDTKEKNNKETLNGGGFENPPTPTPDTDILNVDVEEITGDHISVSAETITPPSSAAPPHDEANPNKKTLFRNSTAANRETFFKTFGGEEYATLDMEHYYNAVADWSDSSNTMRTPRGWFATVRTFIRGDRDKKRLHTKQQAQGRFNLEGAIKYLKNDFN